MRCWAATWNVRRRPCGIRQRPRRPSVSGDLTLMVPSALSAEVSAESFSGHLRTPGAKVQREEFGPGLRFTARYGADKGEIRLETFSGDAELRLLALLVIPAFAETRRGNDAKAASVAQP